MKILLDRKGSITKESICAIGSFDGVHRGHQAIVRQLENFASAKRKIGIITFIPLPFFVLKKAPIFYLTPKKEKERIFNELGVNFIYYFKFTEKFAGLNPDEFVKLIATKIEPSTVVVGENFHFGKGRSGTAELLKQKAKDIFQVEILSLFKDEGTISSTRIRELLLLGHIRAANNLMGREYAISGKIIKGKGKGTQLGFPTINISVPKDKLLPLDGVYKVTVGIDKHEFLGAMFCRHDLVEVHLLNFSGDLYEKEVFIKVLERIRDIKRFSDENSLKAAIAADVQKIKQ